MSKMGRPTVPKREAKATLRGAMFARDEAKAIDKAAADSGMDKSKWIRNNLLWAAKRENVRSDKWTADDLEGKIVRFVMVETAKNVRRGLGRLLAIQRGDGSMDVRIWTREASETDPTAYNDVPVSQAGVDLIKKAPQGADSDFILIDPNAP